ncbi:MAG: transposase zinc-binding domain-containing protein [Proteobacteria bacterium]|nr:transposase zinc-binding domain-containing protein [Pseudomonadota bacterium]
MSAAQFSHSQIQKTPVYVPRNPTQGKVFQVIQKHWKKFELEASSNDQSLSQYVKREFEAFLGCGILSKGFIRLVCDVCKVNRFVPFSCKKRGFCPSCCGRRMNEGAAFLVDHVFPHVPIRQWVVSFPMPLRFWMARNPGLATVALQIFQRILKRHYIRSSKKLGGVGNLQAGSIIVVQRFGGALNLNIHFHILSLDGVYQISDSSDKTPKFIETGRPKNQEILNIIKTFQLRMLKLLHRRGLVQKIESENGCESTLELPNIETLLQGASVQYRIATGPNFGRKVRKIGSFGTAADEPFKVSDLSAVLGGYSIHAATYVHKNNRTELERLCRYILRPPVAEQRCEIKKDKILYHFNGSIWVG